MPRARSQFGFTLIEVITYMAILGILLATALPQLDTRRQKTNTVIKNLVADVRLARAKAITSGTHYCVHTMGSNRYQVRRLKQSGTSWLLDKVVKDVPMPSHMGFWMQTDQGSHLKFNTRGMQVAYYNPNNVYPLYVYFWDSYGAVHAVSVWPSGQTYEEW